MCPTINPKITTRDIKLWNKMEHHFFNHPSIFNPSRSHFLPGRHRFDGNLLHWVQKRQGVDATSPTPLIFARPHGRGPCVTGSCCCCSSYFKHTVLGWIYFAWNHFRLTTIPGLLTNTHFWGSALANCDCFGQESPSWYLIMGLNCCRL